MLIHITRSYVLNDFINMFITLWDGDMTYVETRSQLVPIEVNNGSMYVTQSITVQNVDSSGRLLNALKN